MSLRKPSLISLLTAWTVFLSLAGAVRATELADQEIQWSHLPPIPDALGVAGPFVGVHRDSLIVAGGANFPRPVWETEKKWVDNVYVLRNEGGQFQWTTLGKLPRRVAYGCSVSIPTGVLCIGGCDEDKHFREVFLIKLDQTGKQFSIVKYPPLPQPCAYASAARLGDTVYVVGGQSHPTLASATRTVWTLDLSQVDEGASVGWKRMSDLPAPDRAFHLLATTTSETADTLFLFSGRRENANGQVEFLRDTWQYLPKEDRWIQRATAPTCMMAGTSLSLADDYIHLFGGADGTLFHQVESLKDNHPGFPKRYYRYQVSTDQWTEEGSLPANHVTTVAVEWNGEVVIPTGEIRPRVRTPAVLRGRVVNQKEEIRGQ